MLKLAEREMTSQGWNPDEVFTKALRQSVLTAQRNGQAQPSPSATLNPVEVSFHRFPADPCPSLP